MPLIPRNRRFRNSVHSLGFTLIEILVALLVLSIGLLGLAAAQLQSLQNSHASFERNIAIVQARDLAERMWAGLCDLYDDDGNIRGNVEDLIWDAWKSDHKAMGDFSGPGWSPTWDRNDDVWTITISWTPRIQDQEEQLVHSFRIPPRPNDACGVEDNV